MQFCLSLSLYSVSSSYHPSARIACISAAGGRDYDSVRRQGPPSKRKFSVSENVRSKSLLQITRTIAAAGMMATSSMGLASCAEGPGRDEVVLGTLLRVAGVVGAQNATTPEQLNRVIAAGVAGDAFVNYGTAQAGRSETNINVNVNEGNNSGSNAQERSTNNASTSPTYCPPPSILPYVPNCPTSGLMEQIEGFA